jgi:hypothetical protein
LIIRGGESAEYSIIPHVARRVGLEIPIASLPLEPARISGSFGNGEIPLLLTSFYLFH